jgi:hypothetical protein
MKTLKKTKKETKDIYVFDFGKSKHAKWNKRRRFGM